MSKSQNDRRDPITSSEVSKSTLSNGAQKVLKAKESSTAYSGGAEPFQSSSSSAGSKPVCLPSGSYPPREHEEFGLFLVQSSRYDSR